METKRPSTESLRAIAAERSFLKRLFDSVVDDTRQTICDYNCGKMNEAVFIHHLAVQIKTLRSLSARGEMQEILTRAELVMLERVCRDIGNTEDAAEASAAEQLRRAGEQFLADEPAPVGRAVSPGEMDAAGTDLRA